MKQPNVAVYGSLNCSDTVRSTRYLDKHEIAYEFKDLDESPELDDYVAGLNGGNRVMPTIRIDNEVLINPSDQELADVLQHASTERS